DGLFGIGMSRPPAEPYASWIRQANESARPILALDIASGLDADSGAACEVTIRAAHTTTFIALKPGLLTGAGVALSGAISVHGLELDRSHCPPPDGYRLDWASIRARLPRREADAHKGRSGTLAILGGSAGMVGAALLAGRAALHAGAGKVL